VRRGPTTTGCAAVGVKPGAEPSRLHRVIIGADRVQRLIPGRQQLASVAVDVRPVASTQWSRSQAFRIDAAVNAAGLGASPRIALERPPMDDLVVQALSALTHETVRRCDWPQ
jgi:hypothetical protein